MNEYYYVNSSILVNYHSSHFTENGARTTNGGGTLSDEIC